MKIEYVTVCVNYLDFLKVSYSFNKDANAFDHHIVVTDFVDRETEKFCLVNNITCVKTNSFYENNAIFNKGLAINEGFKHLIYKDWVCFMDADTFVHKTFRKDLESLQLNKEYFYGNERVLLRTEQDVIKYQNGAIDTEFEIPEGFGYGWLQLFNWNSEVIRNIDYGKWYPSYPNCRESDWMFRIKWGDFQGSHQKWVGKFDKLPFRSYNLGDHGINHFGRISKKFEL